MKTRPEVLFLAHRIPYPPDKGDKIRSWRLLQRLCKRFDVHLGCFVDDNDDWRHVPKLESMCASSKFVALNPVKSRIRSAQGFLTGEALTTPYYKSSNLQQWARNVRNRPLAAEIVFSSSMAPYIELAAGARPRLVDLCDADSAKWRQYAQSKKGPMSFVYAREARLLSVLEQNVINWADAVFAISPEEAREIDQGAGKVRWFGNGVDTDYFNPDHAYEEFKTSANIVFVGAMDYWANIDAVTWFVKESWPAIRRAYPAVTFSIVGARPNSTVMQLAQSPGVSVEGRVPDVRPWLHHADLVIAPMRIARGVQNKVLEAMAMGKPIVATSDAIEGINASAEDNVLIADEASDIASGVTDLMSDDRRRQTLGANARRFVVEHYSWAGQLNRFDEALDEVLQRYRLPSHVS